MGHASRSLFGNALYFCKVEDSMNFPIKKLRDRYAFFAGFDGCDLRPLSYVIPVVLPCLLIFTSLTFGHEGAEFLDGSGMDRDKFVEDVVSNIAAVRHDEIDPGLGGGKGRTEFGGGSIEFLPSHNFNGVLVGGFSSADSGTSAYSSTTPSTKQNSNNSYKGSRYLNWHETFSAFLFGAIGWVIGFFILWCTQRQG
jgi:hypothetical protein